MTKFIFPKTLTMVTDGNVLELISETRIAKTADYVAKYEYVHSETKKGMFLNLTKDAFDSLMQSGAARATKLKSHELQG